MSDKIYTILDLVEHTSKRFQRSKDNSISINKKILHEIFNTLFYTSLKTEEGQQIRVTIVYFDPNQVESKVNSETSVAHQWQVVPFSKPIPYTVSSLVKLSKAADVWSSSLAVYTNDDGSLEIWGMVDQALHFQSFLHFETQASIQAPGIFQSTITGVGSLNVLLEYELIASLTHDHLITNYVNVLERNGPVETLLNSFFSEPANRLMRVPLTTTDDDDELDWRELFIVEMKHALSRILLGVQNYQHGGALLITSNQKAYLSTKYQLGYSRIPSSIGRLTKHTKRAYIATSTIDALLESNEEHVPKKEYLTEYNTHETIDETWREIKGAIRYVASLSRVDGLILMDTELNVHGFGTVIQLRKEGPNEIWKSRYANPTEKGLQRLDVDNFGTRHRSMFNYCWNNPGSLGFIVSQDGDVRAVTRVEERLILWENIRIQQFQLSKRLTRMPKRTSSSDH